LLIILGLLLFFNVFLVFLLFLLQPNTEPGTRTVLALRQPAALNMILAMYTAPAAVFHSTGHF